MQFLLWLRVSKLNQAGTAPVYLRIFLDNTTRSEYATHIRCQPERWQGGERKIKGLDQATRLANATLDTIKATAQLLARDMQRAASLDPALPRVTPADVAAALRPKPAGRPAVSRLLPHLHGALVTRSSKPGTRRAAGQALRWLGKWPPAARLALADLTAEVAACYVQWLAQQPGAVSSKRAHLGALAGLLAHAAPGHAPVFAKLGRLLGTPQEPASQVLPEDWQAQLRALRLPRAQALARDAFLLAYYLHGSRIGAVLELQWQHIDWQQQRVRFTTHKHPVAMDISLRPELAELLTRYRGRQAGQLVLPCLPADYLARSVDEQFHLRRVANNCVGQALKGICRKLGWPKLKPHMARHTLALNSYRKNGNDLRVPQQLLGHKHLSTTATYIARLDAGQLDQSAANAYD